MHFVLLEKLKKIVTTPVQNEVAYLKKLLCDVISSPLSVV